MKEIAKKCSDTELPCSITFKIGETMDSFNSVINIFTENGFQVKDFVDNHLCILSRDIEGINEAVKVHKDKIQVQATSKTMNELGVALAKHCKDIE